MFFTALVLLIALVLTILLALSYRQEAASEGEESRAVRKSLRNAQAALKASEAQDDKANASYDRLQSQLDAEKQTTAAAEQKA
ncbi:TPA: hypothetical protein ACH3X2_002942 [Trebouxia sp. C0005]